MKLIHGDCLEKLKDLEDNSIDSIVTDPPYGLSFMGKKWDYDVPSVDIWIECLRVLKSGGHLLAFAGSRTYHRMAVRIEDAGFEIRDQIMWIYGSGFPKSLNIGKAVDKKLGTYRGNSEWEGWGTALKPAHEPIVMARKAFKGTVVDNVLEWGTGGINIDDSRIEIDPNDKAQRYGNYNVDTSIWGNSKDKKNFHQYTQTLDIVKGRFPANVIFDKEAGKILDEQSSEASRFFYCPKTSKKDRDEGMEHLQSKSIKGRDEGQDKTSIAYKARPTERKNIHPTVKPTDLMLYLIRLVTPKGKTTLDPFMGSGSTGKAAVRGGFDFIGIEREEEYINIAQARIEYEQEQVKKKNIQKKLF
jgi:DNA modification methylase